MNKVSFIIFFLTCFYVNGASIDVDTLNSASLHREKRFIGDWFEGAFNTCKNFAESTVEDTLKWFEKAGKDAATWIVTAADDTGKWVEIAAKDVAKFGGKVLYTCANGEVITTAAAVAGVAGSTGASVGSVIPVVGTAVGAIGGAYYGALCGAAAHCATLFLKNLFYFILLIVNRLVFYHHSR